MRRGAESSVNPGTSPHWLTQPVFDRFQDIIVSGTEKLTKPGAPIYALAIDRFGIDPAGDQGEILVGLADRDRVLGVGQHGDPPIEIG